MNQKSNNQCLECERETVKGRNRCSYCIISNGPFLLSLTFVGLLMLPVSYSAFMSSIQVFFPTSLAELYEFVVLAITAFIGPMFFAAVVALLHNYRK